jgi:hypothetical protein
MDNRHVLILAMKLSEIVETLKSDEALLDHTKERLAYTGRLLDEHIELMKTEIFGPLPPTS